MIYSRTNEKVFYRKSLIPIEREDEQNGKYISVVSLSGFLKRRDIIEIDRIITDELKSGIHKFILDFSGVHHLSYRDVSLLMDFERKVNEYKGEIKFVVKDPYLIDILFVGGWPFTCNFYPDYIIAINAFKNEYFLTWRNNANDTHSSTFKRNN